MVVVIAGIWVSGGLITNEYTVATALTAVWMGLAAVAAWPWCGAAWSATAGRVAYLLTAAVAGLYLGRSQLFDDEVDERVVIVAPAEAPAAAGTKPRRGTADRRAGQGSSRWHTRPAAWPR